VGIVEELVEIWPNEVCDIREFREGAVCGGAVDDWGRDGTEFCEEAEN